MARTAVFEENADRLVKLVEQIPAGRVTTYGALGNALGIVPRYVALLMATHEDMASAPWHRVVSAGGVLRTKDKRGEHRRRLEAEGLKLKGDRIDEFDLAFFTPPPLRQTKRS